MTPRAGEDRVVGVVDGTLRVRVRAAAADGAANQALLELLARALDAPRSSLTLLTGASSRMKLIGVDESLLERVRKLWPPLAD